MGFDPTVFSLDLNKAILILAGFPNHDDDGLLDWYYETLEEYSKKLNCGNDAALSELALEFYLRLQVKVIGFGAAGTITKSLLHETLPERQLV
ncbi:hypothetical protein JMN32_16740 [Fulvivirga sp. 29W222]|uniref:Uncharacterized protein n=1 Tax=Fulvivirga marina TaxID=2494733 RepID=A0A937G0M6_9BACT|nr:hypothetical protein [Fulvivirga marina]MBL6447966.1 hypothetical protein [Fulvivirga marina]